LQPAAGVEKVVRSGVFRKVRGHRADDGQIVCALGDVRKQFAYRDAALAVILELPGAAERRAIVVELRWLDRHLERPAVLHVQ
jgi:hypothetical protein